MKITATASRRIPAIIHAKSRRLSQESWALCSNILINFSPALISSPPYVGGHVTSDLQERACFGHSGRGPSELAGGDARERDDMTPTEFWSRGSEFLRD